MTTAELLLAELRAEFTEADAEQVTFLDTPPSVFTAPSVVVTPGDPFIENDTLGLLRERWEILVIVAMLEKSSAIVQMGAISRRVRRAVSKAGATWREASGPRTPQSNEARALVLCINKVDFKTGE